MPEQKEIIRLKDIHKSYPMGKTQVRALRGVNFTLYEGDFAALVGASGSGKSTLLNLIGSIDEADAGEIVLQGQSLAGLSDIEKCHLRNEKIGFIFQSFNLIPVLNVYENVEIPLLINHKMSDLEKKERVTKAIQSVGLSDFQRHLPDQLSGGQRQRVAIARALVNHPTIILADEPTANLDSKTAHTIIDLMWELNQKQKVSFLFCTHDEKVIGRVKRVLRMEDGALRE